MLNCTSRKKTAASVLVTLAGIAALASLPAMEEGAETLSAITVGLSLLAAGLSAGASQLVDSCRKPANMEPALVIGTMRTGASAPLIPAPVGEAAA